MAFNQRFSLPSFLAQLLAFTDIKQTQSGCQKAAANQYSKTHSFSQVEVTTCLLRHTQDLCTVSRKQFREIKAIGQFQSSKAVRGDSWLRS